MKKEPTFDEIPSLILDMRERIELMDNKITYIVNRGSDAPVWFNIKGLQEYIPSHPSIQTIYGWCSTGTIPFHKVGEAGKQNIFLKSEIDEWLSSRGRRSNQMLSIEAQEYVKNKKNE